MATNEQQQAMPGAIIAMLRNGASGKYHPIIFLSAPFPGGRDGARYKSRDHHPDGFAKRDDATRFAETEWVPKVARCETVFSGDILWDGEGIPAMSLLFGRVDGELRPLL